MWLTGIESFNLVLFKTNDIGFSFDSLYTGFDTFSSNNPIGVVNNGYVFLASRNSILDGITRSTNGGFFWEQVLNINNTTPTVYANDDGVVITGTTVFSLSDTNNIYISTNLGSSWKSIPQPTAFGVSVTDIKQDLMDTYFFGTSSDGLYEVDIITGVEDVPSVSSNFYLSQNYPNPFNPLTKIIYSVPISEIVKIKVYNILGQEIKTLLNKFTEAGTYEIEFDGSNLSSGIYFYRLINCNYSISKKMILMR